MSFLYRILAESIVFFHVFFVLMILFGWMMPSLTWLYGFTLVSTSGSWLVFKRCVLVDIEYYFRSKYSEVKRPEENAFLEYWGKRLLGDGAPDDKFIVFWGTIFLTISIIIWCGNLYLEYCF